MVEGNGRAGHGSEPAVVRGGGFGRAETQRLIEALGRHIGRLGGDARLPATRLTQPSQGSAHEGATEATPRAGSATAMSPMRPVPVTGSTWQVT